MYTSTKVLQTTSVISKTVQAAVGDIVKCTGYNFAILHFTYTKGDETGLIITPFFVDPNTGAEIPVTEWAQVDGVYSGKNVSIQATATITGSMKFDTTGFEKMRFRAGGSNNDGTPTGTLKASVVLVRT